MWKRFKYHWLVGTLGGVMIATSVFLEFGMSDGILATGCLTLFFAATYAFLDSINDYK